VPAVLPGTIGIVLMLLWAEHDGGYDQDTWYWGALVLLAVLAASAVRVGPSLPLRRRAKWAIALFALYVLWSYASIAWAGSPGDALDGSNRALLYLIVFSLFAILPWTPEGALAMLVAFALGVGAIALAVMYRLAAADQVSRLVEDGRLIAPTGYFNSSVALFMTAALLATALSVRRELAAPIRGLLIASACLDLQLALIGQSRGWLFTLPLVLIFSLAIVRNRFRTAAAALIPTVATVVPIGLLLKVFQASTAAALDHAAARAGRAGLLIFAVAFFVGTLIAWADALVPHPDFSARARKSLAAALITIAASGAVAGAFVATHGEPLQFVERQWNGFSHGQTGGGSSHFATVGSHRYDVWRVALDAFVANPIGGLGQDNFDNYYVIHRRSDEEPAWPHSLEMRLLACTGIVGFLLFVGFLIAALRGAVRVVRSSRRPAPGTRDLLGPAVCAIALLPLVDWLLHGSVDWFWEMPALGAPALGFLGMAVALDRPAGVAGNNAAADLAPRAAMEPGRTWRRPACLTVGGLAMITAVAALGFPYLSVREVSTASDLQASNPGAALSDLKLAAQLDPLNAEPGRLGGTIALDDGLFSQAEQFYQQSIDRDPGGWLAWLGKGLAASALGDSATATQALTVAVSINKQEPASRLALERVNTTHPLSPRKALAMIVIAG
jgi:hypothetical protein